tara:strand:- start:2955 stop:3227 length:273 start_codon:yes stop_codon:yes gene_type:complete
MINPVETMIDRGLAKGLTVSVDGGGDEFDLENSTDLKQIMEDVTAVDDAHIHFFSHAEEVGWVYVVNWNDPEEQISDYSANPLMDELCNV